MLTTSTALQEAQRSPSAAPYVQVLVSDRDLGVIRLGRWERAYSGSEEPGPCRLAAGASGLVRVRIDPVAGRILCQVVADPGGASADFSAWDDLADADAGHGLGCAAAGDRVLLASVDGTSIQVHESTDAGVTFAAPEELRTDSGVEAIACAIATDGAAVVVYALAGIVYSMSRPAGGAWQARLAWSQSLASVSGLAAALDNDWTILVSGVDGAGRAGVWSTRLGRGVGAPPGVWSNLAPVALADPDTDVEYVATGVIPTGPPLAAFSEAYSGASPYHQAFLATAISGAIWSDGAWREPYPFDVQAEDGAGATLAQSRGFIATADGVWRSAVIESSPQELTDQVTRLEIAEGNWTVGRLRLYLDSDSIGTYLAGSAVDGLRVGGELDVRLGYVTASGPATSTGRRYWIQAITVTEERGRAALLVEAVDALGRVATWTPQRQLTFDSTTAAAIAERVARQAGATLATIGSLSAAASAAEPPFTVRTTDAGDTVLRRLLQSRFRDFAHASGLQIVVADPVQAATQTVRDTFGPADAPWTRVAVRAAMADAAWARVLGAGGVVGHAFDQDSVDVGGPSRVATDEAITAGSGAVDRAEHVMARIRMGAVRAELTSRPNGALQPNDVVALADARLGLNSQALRVQAIRFHYERGARGRYEMHLQLGAVE